MMNVKELRHSVKNFLELKNCNFCDADVTLILMKVLNISKTQMLVGDKIVTSEEETAVFEYAKRLAVGEPVQYIINECEFMSLPFYVERGVLIPRDDTEILVEEVIRRLDKDVKLSVADLCCGSGCIGISIAKYMKNIQMHFYDISETAIRVTDKNAERLIGDRDYCITQMDLINDFPTEYYDCIVSNPPYIESCEIDSLEKKVKCFEPKEALDGGNDGLTFYERIASAVRLKNGGIIGFEIGYNQGEAVSKILQRNGYSHIEILKDIEDRDRVVIARNNSQYSL